MTNNTSSKSLTSFNKNTPLERIFKNENARILDFFIINQKFDYTANEVSKSTKIGLKHVYQILKLYKENELIVNTGKIGSDEKYILNLQSPLVHLLINLFNTTLNIDIDKITLFNNHKNFIKVQSR